MSRRRSWRRALYVGVKFEGNAMKKFLLLWWAIQVNAVICFLLFGYVGTSSESTTVKMISFAALISAAIVEFLAYRSIYKPKLTRAHVGE